MLFTAVKTLAACSALSDGVSMIARANITFIASVQIFSAAMPEIRLVLSVA